MGTVPDDRSPEPPSRRVERLIRARIAANEWQSGERLPSVAEFAAQYSVARSTVTTAQRRIAADGLIQVVSHWGVFRA